MFANWGSLMYRRRWLVIVTTLVITVGGGLWGLGVFDRLSQGGYEDMNSESIRAASAVEQQFGKQAGDVLVVYTAPEGKTIDDPQVAGAITGTLDALPKDAVRQVVDYWHTRSPQFADSGHQRGLASITLAASGSNDQLKAYERIKDSLAVPGVHSEVAGYIAVGDATNKHIADDLVVAETISLPLTLILLVVIFGSLVAASLPVLIGALSMIGALGLLRLLTLFVEVNSFAINVVTLLGLGLAIDYALFSVGRFREEIAAGHSSAEAVRRTVATTGRTVAFSGTLLVIALAGVLVMPVQFLKSLAYGGMAAVALAAIISLTLLPALLGALGPRVDKVRIRLPRRNRAAATDPRWLTGLASAVLRRPVLLVVPILALLLLLASPVLSIKFGGFSEKQLPPDEPTRITTEQITRDFPVASSQAAQIVLRGNNGAPGQAEVVGFAAAVQRVPGVHGEVRPAGSGGNLVVLAADVAGEPTSDESKATVRAIRDLPEPPGTEVLVGGGTALIMDSVTAVTTGLPWMIGIVAVATLVLMFLAFGSVLLPIKAVLVSALSLTATFGILVWIFQFGHGAGLLGITPEPVQPGLMVFIAALVFGLSTDYETFLLSRMVEARSHGLSTRESIRTGLVRTGRPITAAALLLITVTGAFALSSVSTMRFTGLGMIIALILDATVVRLILVPGVIRLLGDAAWWAPGPLRRLQRRIGLQETDEVRDLEVAAQR